MKAYSHPWVQKKYFRKNLGLELEILQKGQDLLVKDKNPSLFILIEFFI